jgi:hypothetical protein
MEKVGLNQNLIMEKLAHLNTIMHVMDFMDEKYEALVKVLWYMEVMVKKQDQRHVDYVIALEPNVEAHPLVIILKSASKVVY